MPGGGVLACATHRAGRAGHQLGARLQQMLLLQQALLVVDLAFHPAVQLAQGGQLCLPGGLHGLRPLLARAVLVQQRGLLRALLEQLLQLLQLALALQQRLPVGAPTGFITFAEQGLMLLFALRQLRAGRFQLRLVGVQLLLGFHVALGMRGQTLLDRLVALVQLRQIAAELIALGETQPPAAQLAG